MAKRIMTQEGWRLHPWVNVATKAFFSARLAAERPETFGWDVALVVYEGPNTGGGGNKYRLVSHEKVFQGMLLYGWQFLDATKRADELIARCDSPEHRALPILQEN